MRRFRLLLDAGVLVDARVRDVFLGLAEADLVDLCWSEPLLGELRALLVDDMGRRPAQVERLCVALRQAFPLSEIVPSEAVAGRLAGAEPEAPAPLVAAVTGEIDLLVTHDRRRFPPDDELARWNLEVRSPGDALAEVVDLLGAERVASVVGGLTEALGLAPADLRDRLRALRQVAPLAAIAIGAHLDLDGTPGGLRDYLLGTRPDDARAAVSELVNRVGDGDLAGMDALLSPAARGALGPSARVRHATLMAAFADVLAAPGDWGFGAARRVAAPGGEIVALVPADAPPVPEGHGAGDGAIVFALTREGDRWRIDDIDLPG